MPILITARIRRMTEGNIFSMSTLVEGGYPISGLDRGVPHPRSRWGVPRVPHIQDWDRGEVPPHPSLDGVPPIQTGIGVPRVPPSKTGWGTPIQTWDGGVPRVPPPPSNTGWGTPHQQSEHLLCSRWCASCVHAGGLSCLKSIFGNMWCNLKVTNKITQDQLSWKIQQLCRIFLCTVRWTFKWKSKLLVLTATVLWISD